MESNHFVRKLDELGRLVIPKELRNQLHWHNEVPIQIILLDDGIKLKLHTGGCFICGNEENLKTVKNKSFCKNCIEDLNE